MEVRLMSNSIKRHIGVQDFVVDFLMMQGDLSKRGKAWIFLEGDDDKKLFAMVFDKNVVELVSAGGIVSVQSVVDQLLQRSFRNVIGIIDADFSRLSEPCQTFPNIFMADNHDAEMMLLGNTAVFERITFTYLNDANLNYGDVRNAILNAVVWFGFVRWYNHINDAKLYFKGFPIHQYINLVGDKFQVRQTECLAILNQRSKDKTREISESDIEQTPTTSDYWNLCNGHDFLKVWAMFLKEKSHENVNENDLHRNLCLAFTSDVFRSTNLYKEISQWLQISDYSTTLFKS